jgi:hypothetical protein
MTRYVELRTVWRRNRRKQFAVLALALAALAAAGFGYDLLMFGRMGFVGGVCCGATGALWFAVRDSPRIRRPLAARSMG